MNPAPTKQEIAPVRVMNIKQGTVWHITDPAMLKRMAANNKEYKILDGPESAEQGLGPGSGTPVGASTDIKSGAGVAKAIKPTK
jgi:hypothetical protein